MGGKLPEPVLMSNRPLSPRATIPITPSTGTPVRPVTVTNGNYSNSTTPQSFSSPGNYKFHSAQGKAWAKKLGLVTNDDLSPRHQSAAVKPQTSNHSIISPTPTPNRPINAWNNSTSIISGNQYSNNSVSPVRPQNATPTQQQQQWATKVQRT